jgi:hypothetical protein
MAVKIVEHALEYQDRVQAFNRRMKQKGSPWAFYVNPVPRWIPRKGNQSVWREYYLALDDDKEVRGGYCLKRQAFWFGGKVHQIASFQGPVSEGAVDRKYSLATVCMMRDMLAREPELFAFGSNADVTRLLRANRWRVLRTPLCLKIVRPYRFLRLNRMLRGSTSRKWIMDALALSGLGSIGLKSLTSIRKVLHGCPVDAEYEIVETFDDWSDELWLSCCQSYGISAVRDREAMNLLMPKEGWPPVIRLKINFGSRVIGTAAVLDTQMQDDCRFGSLRVGTIVENFGQLEHGARIVAAATNLLEQRGVDLIISNQTHPQWLRGFRANGFQILEDRRVLALSASLERQWGPAESLLSRLHMNTIDGDGPLGLAPMGPPRSEAYSEQLDACY